MQFFENLQGAWTILKRNKVRSFLTMLGIIIGVLSVVVILSVGAGAQGLILNQVTSLGSNLIGVLPGKSEESGPPAAAFGIVITTLKNDDAKALVTNGNPHIVAATVYVRGASTVTAQEEKTDTTFVGVSAAYPRVEDMTLASGRWFSDDEEQSLARVAILGSAAASELFGDRNPIGEQIKIKRTNFQVIGVVKERGIVAFQNQDNQVFVPVTVAQKLLLGIDYANFMRVKIDRAENVPDSMEYITQVLRERHGITNPDNDDFSIRSTNQGLQALTSITNALQFFLAAIAALSLIVGGIGIMNIMLAAVEERTREIGLRKAVGATNGNIIIQFLTETVMITLVGGVIGIIFGILISVIVMLVARSQGYNWNLVVSPGSIVLACAVAISIGLIFGVSPARRAAALNPIEALRYE